MATVKQEAGSKAAAPIRPDDLRKITKSAEVELVKEEAEADRKAAEERKAFEEAFMAREVRADAVGRVNEAVRRAAEARKHEIEIVRFPASFCSDGGRRINNNEADWPNSLEGFAKRAFEAYVEHFKPLGYKLKAQVMSYPNGMLGDIAIFLTW
jgi:hypothetical protein